MNSVKLTWFLCKKGGVPVIVETAEDQFFLEGVDVEAFFAEAFDYGAADLFYSLLAQLRVLLLLYGL
jgi:hypothetical protein